MLDSYWLDAWEAIKATMQACDRLLLPPGDWPLCTNVVRHYGPTIHVANATILALHKGRLPAISKPMLRGILKKWKVIFANEVFVCFHKPETPRLHNLPPCTDPHVCILYEHLGSCERKRIANTVWFAHLPKTAGTALWETLSQAVPSSIYYDNYHTFLDRPPGRGEYDLIGGHIPLPLLMRMAGPDDVVSGLVRDPVARLRSAFLHSRRLDEDPSTFTPMMRAMREQPLTNILDTYDGKMEARQQSLMLGFDFLTEYQSELDANILAAAFDLLDDPRCRFDVTDQIDRLATELAALLHVSLPEKPISVRNASLLSNLHNDQTEFEAALPQILAATVPDRELYDFIGRSGSARGVTSPARS